MNTPTLPVATLKEIRSFGLIFSLLVVLIFAGLMPWLFNQPMPMWPLVVSTATTLLALVAPSALRPLHSLFIKLGTLIGFINTRLLLFIIFFGLFFTG